MSQRIDAGDDWKRPSPRLVLLRVAEVAGASAVLGLIGLLIGLQSSTSAGISLLVVIAIVGLVVAFVLVRRVKAWGYCEREEELLVRRGLLVRRLSVVPYGRMQFIDVTAGLAERAFQLATVQLHTAAAASDARIPGLSAAEAARLRDTLAARGSRLSGV